VHDSALTLRSKVKVVQLWRGLAGLLVFVKLLCVDCGRCAVDC